MSCKSNIRTDSYISQLQIEAKKIYYISIGDLLGVLLNGRGTKFGTGVTGDSEGANKFSIRCRASRSGYRLICRAVLLYKQLDKF